MDRKKVTPSTLFIWTVNNLSANIGHLSSFTGRLATSVQVGRTLHASHSAEFSRNLTHAVRLLGSLDVSALGQSLDNLTARQRTPDHIPAIPSSEALRVQDFSSLPVEARERQARAYLEREAEHVPLDSEPPIRVAVAVLSASGSILLVSLHPSLCHAGASAGTITVELGALYSSLVSHTNSVSPHSWVAQPAPRDWPLPASRGSSNGSKRGANKEAGALELPSDHPRSSDPGGILGHEARTLPEALLASVRDFSRGEGVGTFATLFSAFASLLSRYSGQQHFSVGASSDSAALTPFQVDVADDPPFRELVQRLRHPHTADLSAGPPLFQVAFVLERPDREAVRFAGLTASDYELKTRTIGLDLILHLDEFSAKPLVTADYNAALFDPDTIQLFLAHYETLLAGAVRDPECSVSRLAVLNGQERHRLVYEWNSTSRGYPADIPLPQLIEAQVEKTPTSLAVSFKDQRLTYAGLNARANQLAAHLRSIGVTRNTLVGVCLERSIDLLITPLAILKAGGAYLPLDPDHPDEHIGPIVENARLEILIGRPELSARLPNFRGNLVLLDWEVLEQYPSTNQPVAVSPGDLAYVIYTSGSTGQPKGVTISRRALNNLLWSMRDWFQFGPSDVLLALTTIAFDIAGVDVWLPLLVGARMLMIERETAMHAPMVQEIIRREGVTFLQCTPTIWKLLIDSEWPGKADLQAVSTGEAMPKDLAFRLFPRVGRLWNMYGPTETTIWSTGYRFSAAADPVLIGRPIANTQIYILDERLDPTPIGVPGELYIGGDGLANGYLHKPELTAERFVADPFSKTPGARLYKTGDLARYRSDGNIECLGRNDDQIKLRGYRIEPEEIRAALTLHPAIRDAIAVLSTSATGESRIVAYLISQTGDPPEVGELRSFLRHRLPEYMIPATFTFLDSFPLSGNGKINRRALPPPKTVLPEIGPAEAPADPIEERLQCIFCSVLGLSSIGVSDDFFDLGGHSLTAAQLFTEINISFDLDLPLATLFHAPTIRRLAALIRDSRIDQMSEPIVPIQRNGSQPPIYCIGAVDGELIVFRRLALELGMDQPLFGLQPFRLLASCPTVKQLAAAYIRELRRTGESEPACLLGYSFGGVVAVEMARQLQRQGRAPLLVMLIDSSYPAGCRANEPWEQRLQRYRFHWDRISNRGGWSHFLERLRYGSARIAHRASSTVGIPLPSQSSDVSALQGLASESYRIKSYPGAVHLFRAESQPEFLTGGVDLGWSRVLSNLAIDHVPGDHGTMNTGINLKILARKIQQCLREAVPNGRRLRV